jgi:WD40 repeat protein
MYLGGQHFQAQSYRYPRGEFPSSISSSSTSTDYGLQDAVTSIAFAPNTTSFITGSADKTLKLWDYRRGSCEQTFLGHRDPIHAVAISRDGKVVISGGEDGVAKVFLTGGKQADVPMNF